MSDSFQQRAIDEQTLDATLSRLVGEEGPPEMRARLEHSIRARSQSSGRTAWRVVRAASAALAVVAISVAVLWLNAPVKHSPRQLVERADPRAAAVDARRRDSSVGSATTHRGRRSGVRTARVAGLRQEPRSYVAPRRVSDDPLPPDWAPRALEGPVPLATESIDPEPMIVAAHVVNELPETAPLRLDPLSPR
jgi:hypothetical protein